MRNKNSYKNKTHVCLLLALFVLLTVNISAQYKPAKPRKPTANEIPIYAPGNYSEPGRTYVLMNDISSERSTLFLGKDVTLDLNGYTVYYARAAYGHVTNSGFEEGLEGWDVTKAPNAKVVNTKDVHVFVGDKLLSLGPGDEVRSSWVNLPVANRSYIAMCGITGRHFGDSLMKGDLKNEMKVSVFVEDENGNEIRCVTMYKDGEKLSSPVERRSPRLGGGFVYAHLNNLPAGKYRIRVRADTDCLVDEIDIRPAFDVGIGIVGETHAFGHYDHIYESKLSAFFDYTADVASGKPHAGIPVVQGRGSVIIRNGRIVNGTVGAISWGVQSTANGVKVILDNVMIKTEGINSIAADVPQAIINNSRFEVENPFIVNRHGSNFYAVDIRGDAPSEVSYSEFIGGQGCLVFKGKHSIVHHNYFRNNQSVTNHYSIMAMGDSSRIFNNHIEPERGSGIEIYTKKYIDIFNNTIKIQSSPPTCEYGKEEYSVNGIRIADYRAKPGAPNGAYGNRVYNNRIFVKAINFPEPKEYIPLAWAVFYSASGGDNDFFGNEIVIEHTDPSSKALATAFNISGGTEGFGGKFYNNRITTNVPAFWVGAQYGGAVNTKIINNTIIKAANAPASFKPVRMGFGNCKGCNAKNITFTSNKIVGEQFSIQMAGQNHSYAVNWQLKVEVKSKNGKPAANATVTLKDKNGTNVAVQKTGEKGVTLFEVAAYNVDENGRTDFSPYTISVGNKSVKLPLDKDVFTTIVL